MPPLADGACLLTFLPCEFNSTPTLMSVDTHPKTILIAEDSSVILYLTRKILELQKYKIVLAKNGGEVLKQLESNEVDCVLMDINIPVKDGMQCTRDIRAHANPAINKLPVIAITGNANNYSMDQFREEIGRAHV